MISLSPAQDTPSNLKTWESLAGFLFARKTNKKMLFSGQKAQAVHFFPLSVFPFPFFFVPGLFLSSSARRTRCINMVPAGCLECFSLWTSSPRRRRMEGWGRLGHGAEGREETASFFCLRVQIFPAEERNWRALVLLFRVLISASPFIPMCQTACRLCFRGPRNLNYRPKYLKHRLIYSLEVKFSGA